MKTLATMLPDYEVRFLGFGVFENRPVFHSVVLAEWIEHIGGVSHYRRLGAYALPQGVLPAQLIQRRRTAGRPLPVTLKNWPDLEAMMWTDGANTCMSVFVPGSRGIVEIGLEEGTSAGPANWDDVRAVMDARLSISRRA